MLDLTNEILDSIDEAIISNNVAFEHLRQNILPLKNNVKQIRPITSAATALVATDGGNNIFSFDPFMLQIIRIVDSSNNELFFEVLNNQISFSKLSKKHFKKNGEPKDALGFLMNSLELKNVTELSHMLTKDNINWVSDYRQIIEWAVLYKLIIDKDFATDTVIIFDGLLRTKVFYPNIFRKFFNKIRKKIKKEKKENNRNIYLVGVAKHSAILSKYHLAMKVEGIMDAPYPCYVEVLPSIEEDIYKYNEWISHTDEQIKNKELHDFCAGNMFLAKFGPNKFDPIWSIDIFMYQKEEAGKILGCMLDDAKDGFPVPFYPHSLLKAHENAALVGLDRDILQEQIYKSVRKLLKDKGSIVDDFILMDKDPSVQRY